MSAVTVDESVGPWTEDDFFALGETRSRIELVDGGLLVSPAPSFLHQEVAHELAHALKSRAAAGWLVIEAGNVRVGPSRILIPDVLVTDMSLDTVVAPAANVELVVEIVSPSTVAQDRMFKPQLYAAAGIPWYLRAELPKTGDPEFVLHRLDEGVYVEHATARGQEALTLTAPFEVTVIPAALLPNGPNAPNASG